VLLPVRTVGVMGDGRTYDQACALRAVMSTDGMTVDYHPFDYPTGIINEMRGINRMTYDITSKPPGTIEWASSRCDSKDPFAITTARRPDFVLAAFNGNRLERWFLLDAKYRTNRQSIQEALESMHIYRDSLRWPCAEKKELFPATSGYLLVPDISDDLSGWSNQAFLDRWHLGLMRIDDPTIAERLVRRPMPNALVG
jgi:hypothetical protein